MNPPPHTSPTSTPVTHRVGEVHSGRVIQAHEAGNITVINTVLRPRPIQLPELPAPEPRPELEHLGTLLRETGVDQSQIIVLHGPAGASKTQIASYLLHQHLDQFTDGILTADLRGSNPAGPADPNSVLDHFLRAIHVGADAIPTDLGARAAAWRSYTYGRKIAVLADDAVSAAQVRVLLPGRGPFLMIVTTRHFLVGLRMDGADLFEIHHPTSPSDQGVS